MKLKDFSVKRSGSGAAHGCAGLPFRRGPLLAEEGAGGSSSSGGGTGGGGTGAGSAGGTGGTGDSAGGTGAGSAGGTGEKTYSPAQVEQIVTDRLARDRATRGKSGRQDPPESTAPSASKADSDSMWVFDLQDAMDAVSDELGVKPPAGLKKRMREDFARTKPSEPHAWVKSWFTDAGLAKPTTTTTTTTPAEAEKSEPAKQGASVATPPISSKGTANGGPRDLDAISDPNQLTKADYERLVAKHGEAEADKRISDMSLRWLKTVRLRVPRRH